MKKLLVAVLLAMLVVPVFGAAIVAAETKSSDETVVVRKSDLPPPLLKDLEEKARLSSVAQRIEAYGKWVGIGKEIGAAVNDSLSAVTTQADNFAKTGVGKFTMFLVAYKVLGKDLIGMVVGIPLLFVWTTIFVVFWRRLYNNRVVLDRVEGKTKFYKVVPPATTGDDRTWIGAFLFVGYLIAMVWTIGGVIL